MPRKRLLEDGKSAPRYAENPFIKHTAETSATRTKPVFMAKDDGIIISPITGELKGTTGIFTKEVVEKNQFIKLYAEGVAAILSLKAPGKKVFTLIYSQMIEAKNIGKTEIVLNYKALSETEPDTLKAMKLGRTTFDRGIKECLSAKILAQTLTPFIYFINPAFMFNGNRLAIIKQYVLKEKEKEKEQTEQTPQQITE